MMFFSLSFKYSTGKSVLWWAFVQASAVLLLYLANGGYQWAINGVSFLVSAHSTFVMFDYLFFCNSTIPQIVRRKGLVEPPLDPYVIGVFDASYSLCLVYIGYAGLALLYFPAAILQSTIYRIYQRKLRKYLLEESALKEYSKAEKAER